jgi:putative chitinase
MTIQITVADVRAIANNPTDEIVDGIVDGAAFIGEGGIDTPLRLSHFMAQLAHESAHFRRTLEFASGAAYEGRKDLGNVKAGDGKRYRGRGLIQTTGRANYREATADIRKIAPDAPDFEAEPVALETFPWALLSAVSYWRRRDINRHADRDDIVAVTRAINGGTNGLDDRRNYLRRTKAVWMGAGGTGLPDSPTLRKGDNGNAVFDLQTLLVQAGFSVLVDGDFGKHTQDAVKEFQRHRGLRMDGEVGPATWAALRVPSS